MFFRTNQDAAVPVFESGAGNRLLTDDSRQTVFFTNIWKKEEGYPHISAFSLPMLDKNQGNR